MTVLLAVLVSLLFVLTAAAATGVLIAVRALRSLDRRFDASVQRARRAALAQDREREMEEARTFWAEQEARAAEDDLYGDTAPGGGLFQDANLALLPAPRGYVDDEGTMDPEFAEALRNALEDLLSETEAGRRAGANGVGTAQGPLGGSAPAAPGHAGQSAHHPSMPGFIPQPTSTPEWTDLRLMELVDVGIVLRDVRPGPMGTLDVYVFEDETTLCVAPGDPETGARIRAAVAEGAEVRLLGSSRLPGGHALTFTLGDETAYILADRVVASL
ncbi:hypothetical protein GXW82_29080 [Streptacidiphilus sp. 4-A2]|nr:hypothetical protein [Streptacidiphilus sp. 4-A2]